MQEFNTQFFQMENDEIKLEFIDIYQENDKELPFDWWNIISKDNKAKV